MGVGGEGGHSFDDAHECGNCGHIVFIEVRVGSYLDYIGIGYANGKRISHGGSGGKLYRINLSENEKIVNVSGRSCKFIDQISFTNAAGKTYGPYGGNGGEPFHFSFEGGNALLHLFGRSASYIDQLGFAHSNI